ncbi:hypothetical protein [Streptomyces sp. WMMC905]|uniref:hypothetical protein n=1 Tax=Streptomyces sp. WMMC905 TaxID=3404123 RepID=UPI003B94621C
MSDSDLIVDITLLRDTEKQLGLIQGEFQSISGWERELRASVGAERMVKAMSEFVDNWDRHRREIVEEISEVGGWVGSARRSFEKLDRELTEKMKQENH